MEYTESIIKQSRSNKFAGEIFEKMLKEDQEFVQYLRDELNNWLAKMDYGEIAQATFGSRREALQRFFESKDVLNSI